MDEKLKALLTSRKFWALLASLLAAAGGYATGQVSVWQAMITAVTAFSVYAGATALEDGLSARRA